MALLTPLPLARAAITDRSGVALNRSVDIPRPLRVNPVENVVGAVAGLLYIYTAEHSIRVRLAQPGLTRDRLVLVTGQAPVNRLHEHVDLTTAVGEDQPTHAQVGWSGASQTQTAPVMIDVQEDSATLRLCADEFDANAADQYAEHLAEMLRILAESPDSILDDVQLLSPDERYRAIHGWNQTETSIPTAYFHDRIADIAQRFPDKIALTCATASITYGQLDLDSDQLAHHLRTLGVARGDRVGVCFLRSIESVIAQIACFRVGAAAILLDPDFPVDRIRFMTVHAEAKIALTVTEYVDKVGAAPAVVCLDGDQWRGEPSPTETVAVDSADLIHICYTSGSTGLPKAVKVRHGAARNLIWSMQQVCGVEHESHGAWLAAPGYGMIEVEVFPLLAAGATVHIPPTSIVASPERLQEWMLREHISHALLMRSMAERLWSLDWPTDAPLRNVRVCGERILAWPRKSLPFHLVNLYGSAEATVVASCDLTILGEQLGDDGRPRRLPPIGRPTANVKTYVLDQHLRPVAPGVVGELCIAGDSLSAGYLNQPEATAAKWVDNPLDPERHPVLYRTGDLGRYWSDGNIEIVGRTDSQVKVRGNRVHLGEIEVVLAAQPGVQQAAVVAKTDSDGDVWLAAYIEPDPEVATSSTILRRELLKRLPSFMVPSAYAIERLPMSTNGKIDRPALPDIARSRADLDTDFTPPADDLEQTLATLWEQLLEIPSIGVEDNFFELGGDSMRAARLAELLQASLGIQIELDDLFTGEATIRGMASALRQPAAA